MGARSCKPALSWVFAWLLLACQDPNRPAPTPSVGSNSNWLRACTTDDDCGDLPACRCGTCTADCDADRACSSFDAARCAFSDDPAVWATCQSSEAPLAVGICLPRCEPGECADGQLCVERACVPARLPDGPLCAAVAEAGAEQRTREEELLALIAAQRSAGALRCGSEGSAAAAAPALRLDTRLWCAARVLARDLSAAGGPRGGLLDAEGRDTQARLREVGYAAQLWGESFAVRAESVEDALRLMLLDLDSCQRLANARFRDVGVGNDGTSWVVTIGAAP
jgi:hypothetical protein